MARTITVDLDGGTPPVFRHRLVNDTLIRTAGGIAARCTCGWSSTHFTSFAASAAFNDHKENSVKITAPWQIDGADGDITLDGGTMSFDGKEWTYKGAFHGSGTITFRGPQR